MRSTIDVLRAISGLFLRSLLSRVILAVGVVLGLLLALFVLLATFIDPWWLIGIFILLPFFLVVGIILSIVWFATSRVLPRKMTADDKVAVSAFTDKVIGLSDQVRTPWPVTAMLVAKDVLRGKESRVLKDFIQGSTSLRSDFVALQSRFTPSPKGS